MRHVEALSWLRADPRRFDLALAIITVGISSLLFLAGPDDVDAGWPDLAAGIGAFFLIAGRRFHTPVLLAVALAWTTVHVAAVGRPTVLIFAILVLLATLCVRLDRWPAIGLGVVVAVSLYVIALVGSDAELGDARAVIGIAWTAGAVGIADATRSWRQYRESADAQVRSAVLAAAAQTQQQLVEERLAIARELHDYLAHNLSVMNVQTGAALHLLRSDPDRAEESLIAARDAGRSVLEETRDLLAVLRHDDSDGAPRASLPTIEELSTLVETMRSAGLTVTWTRTGAQRDLAPAVSLAAYRIVQESLTNAAKHGTGAAELITGWDDEGLTIQIANEIGTQTDTAGGQGLVGMQERASANGGRLVAGPGGDRFVVDAWLPSLTRKGVAE